VNSEELYPCVGICLPDEDEAYCIGCGRPWGTPPPNKTPTLDYQIIERGCALEERDGMLLPSMAA
jgi:hypothetical protein